MNGEDEPAFVDTNVLVYALEEEPTAKQEAGLALVSRLMQERRFRLSTQVIQELFVTLIRKAHPPGAIQPVLDHLDTLSEWEPVVIDYGMIRRAAILTAEASISLGRSDRRRRGAQRRPDAVY
jgi:predicted nucleic acid-binding protein